MNRRHFSAALAASSAAMLVGCDTEQKPAATATLLNNSGVQDALKALEAAVSGLETDVSRFDGESWRDVVPEVQGAADDVRNAFEQLRKELAVPNA